MATLAVQSSAQTGTALTFNATAGGGDQFLNDGDVILIVNNGSGGALTVTFDPGGLPGGLTLADVTGTVDNGDIEAFGPFPGGLYNDSSGYVQVSWSTTTSVTAAVLSVK